MSERDPIGLLMREWHRHSKPPIVITASPLFLNALCGRLVTPRAPGPGWFKINGVPVLESKVLRGFRFKMHWRVTKKLYEREGIS